MIQTGCDTFTCPAPAGRPDQLGGAAAQRVVHLGRAGIDELTELLLSAQDGDQVALSAWIRRSQGEVWRLCAQLVSRDLADDVTQEVYLRAYRALPAFRGESSARTWLLSIARRTCADAVRDLRRRRRLAARFDRPSYEPDPARVISVEALLSGLDPERRLAFVLTQVLGLSYLEAAEICDCPVGTIRSRVARARADLLTSLGETAV
ncbi:MAG TPA: sigma-70 family RNA polymerase sigma factor [Acidimicrobiia bacterium]|nr:sigma-70 family RNA polymerase sigma factor [Acidimicrobiia bacterium]